jgi:NusA-like KH domain protein
MSNIIDMQLMRYINLFERISQVSTNKCFVYNNIIFFVVPANVVSRAIGRDAENARRMSEILNKKIKIIAFEENIGKFISSIIEPYEFVKCEITADGVNLTANKQNKAGIIGRNRTREEELESILKKFFGIEKLKIL